MKDNFKIPKSSLIQNFAVYIIICKPTKDNDEKKLLYVGKTGDNRIGCNPIISRIGNHFSFNKVHSQSRNKIQCIDNYEFEIFYDHFNEYKIDDNRDNIDEINEMERELNKRIQALINNNINFELLNKLKDKHYKTKKEIEKRLQFHTTDNKHLYNFNCIFIIFYAVGISCL